MCGVVGLLSFALALVLLKNILRTNHRCALFEKMHTGIPLAVQQLLVFTSPSTLIPNCGVLIIIS